MEVPVEIKSSWTRPLIVLKESVKNNRQTTLNVILGTLCILLLALVVIQMLFIFSDPESEPTSSPAQPTKCVHTAKPKNQQISNTREYQIELAGIKSWSHRNQELERWIDAIGSLSSIDLQFEEVQQLFHDEHNVSPKKCHSKDSFRIRTYYNSDVVYNTTIDVKANGGASNEVCASPFWPAPQYPSNQTAQKCEQDYHYTYSKFSRETRISMIEATTFLKCADLVENFPWAFDDLKTYELLNDLTPLPIEFWWLGKNVGYLDGDTKYQIEFTLQYRDLESALNGSTAPMYGEFSIRLYSLDGGLDPAWNENAITETETLWYGLMDVFGNKEMNKRISQDSKYDFDSESN